MKDDAAQVVQNKLLSSIVQIVEYENDSEIISKGTGFLLTEDGLIATCSHVVQDPIGQESGAPITETVGVIFPLTKNYENLFIGFFDVS